MEYTNAVMELIADPFGGRTPEDVLALCQSELAKDALAHEADTAMLERFAKSRGVDLARARAIFEDTKRFLVVGRLVGAQLAPSEPVDEMWHSWILFTKDYHAFCDMLGGYIHHKPIPTGSPEQPPLDPTVALIEAGFGALDEQTWPLALGARGIMDCKMGA